MRPEINFAGRAMQGDREDQEDFYAFEPLTDRRLLLVLADGAGGEASGELASRNAALGFLDYFAKLDDAQASKLGAALDEANIRLAQFIDRDTARRSTMATTLLAFLLDGSDLYWISVGDSPLLLYRAGKLVRLNEDHSGAGQGSADVPHAKNMLLSALVGGRIPIIDWRHQAFDLKADDVLIAASDGLWTLSSEQIAECVGERETSTAADIATHLLDRVAAHKKPRQDNVTVTVVKRNAATRI